VNSIDKFKPTEKLLIRMPNQIRSFFFSKKEKKKKKKRSFFINY